MARGKIIVIADFMTTGRLERIWSKRAHRGPMDAFTEATLGAGQGVLGSTGRSRRRQVTILSRESWEAAVASLAEKPDASARRANLLVSGIDLCRSRGQILRIGVCRIRIGGELTPCERMEEATRGLQAALHPDWRGGVFGQVLTGGVVRVGDRVEWERGPEQMVFTFQQLG